MSNDKDNEKDNRPIFFAIGILLIGIALIVITILKSNLEKIEFYIVVSIILFISFSFCYLCLRLIYKESKKIYKDKILDKCINAFNGYLDRIEPNAGNNPVKKN